MYRKVTQFQAAFGLLIAERPSFPDRATRDLRIKLLEEELNEFLGAEAADDIVEVADALADIAYILCGTAVSYGIVPGDGSTPPCSPTQKPGFPSAVLRNRHVNGVRSAFRRYLDAEAADDLDAVSAALNDLRDEVFTTALCFGIPLTAVFEEVHRSNMSKLLPDGTVLRRADGKVMKPETYSPPDIRKVLFGE